MSHEHHQEEKHEHCAFHHCLKIAKVVLKAASVVAAICIAHEIHKVHRSIEAHK